MGKFRVIRFIYSTHIHARKDRSKCTVMLMIHFEATFLKRTKNLLWNVFFENYVFQMLPTAAYQTINPLSPILGDSFEPFDW